MKTGSKARGHPGVQGTTEGNNITLLDRRVRFLERHLVFKALSLTVRAVGLFATVEVLSCEPITVHSPASGWDSLAQFFP